MNKSINKDEGINVSDFNRTETEIDAIIYKNEFGKYYQNFQKSKSEIDIIFCFIFLQIYIECFLHQNMRRIVEMKFKPSSHTVCVTWLKRERWSISKKIENFPTLFFSPVPLDIQRLTKSIKNNFKNIGDIRNLFVHGHKVARWSDSSGGAGLTKARTLLTESQLTQTINGINQIGTAWDDLLDKIITINDFKFPSI